MLLLSFHVSNGMHNNIGVVVHAAVSAVIDDAVVVVVVVVVVAISDYDNNFLCGIQLENCHLLSFRS